MRASPLAGSNKATQYLWVDTCDGFLTTRDCQNNANSTTKWVTWSRRKWKMCRYFSVIIECSRWDAFCYETHIQNHSSAALISISKLWTGLFKLLRFTLSYIIGMVHKVRNACWKVDICERTMWVWEWAFFTRRDGPVQRRGQNPRANWRSPPLETSQPAIARLW